MTREISGQVVACLLFLCASLSRETRLFLSLSPCLFLSRRIGESGRRQESSLSCTASLFLLLCFHHALSIPNNIHPHHHTLSKAYFAQMKRKISLLFLLHFFSLFLKKNGPSVSPAQPAKCEKRRSDAFPFRRSTFEHPTHAF